jgi:hypothetical protein
MYEGVYCCTAAAVLGIALLAKPPALLRERRNPVVGVVNALLLILFAGLVFSAPATTLTGVAIGSGFLVPAFGPRLAEHVGRPLLTIIALRPLWRTVCHPTTGAGNEPLLTTPWYASPEERLMAQITTTHDWMLKLRAYCADDVRAASYSRAKENGEAERDAVAFGLAVMLRAAADDRARQAPAGDEQSARAASALRSAWATYPDLIVHISRALALVRHTDAVAP